MKAKTFVACAFAASTAAASAAWATMPTGPQGTGAYGAPNGAVPVPQSVPPGYVYPRSALDRDPPVNDAAGRRTRGWVHQGPSWATNPPAPA